MHTLQNQYILLQRLHNLFFLMKTQILTLSLLSHTLQNLITLIPHPLLFHQLESPLGPLMPLLISKITIAIWHHLLYLMIPRFSILFTTLFPIHICLNHTRPLLWASQHLLGLLFTMKLFFLLNGVKPCPKNLQIWKKIRIGF